jgi:hypothetical protein
MLPVLFSRLNEAVPKAFLRERGLGPHLPRQKFLTPPAIVRKQSQSLHLENAFEHRHYKEERYYRINPLSPERGSPPLFGGLPDDLNLAVRYFA